MGRPKRRKQQKRIWKPVPRKAELMNLPPELIERISLYLPRTTVRALRCVSRYLNKALSTERVCKRLLYYPERYYVRDVLSGPTAAGVAEVVADLSAGRLGKYQAYEKLQHARLQLCMDGQFEQYGEIPLSSGAVSKMVDDHGEHWVFVNDFQLKKLHIWNITRQPRVHDIVSLSNKGEVQPLPHGYIMVDETNCSNILLSIAIYKFSNPEYKFQFFYRFYYKDIIVMDPLAPVPQLGGGADPGRIALVGDVFVTCDVNLRCIRTFSLHIWRLSDGIKLNEVHLPAKEEEDDDNFSFVFTGLFPGCGYKADLILVFSYLSGKLRGRQKVYIFNLQTRRFTHMLDSFIVGGYILGPCYKYRDKVCFTTGDNKQSILSLDADATGTALAGGRCLKRIEQKPATKAGYMEAKMIIPNVAGMLIIDLEDDSLPEQQVRLDGFWSILGFIVPKLLVITDNSSVKIVSLDGTVIFFEEDLNAFTYCDRTGISVSISSMYPAKLVLQTDDKLLLFSP